MNRAELATAVRSILMQDWDPIGVKEEPTAADEYDTYAAQVARILLTGAPAEVIATYLTDVEGGHMGLAKNAVRAERVARLLTALR